MSTADAYIMCIITIAEFRHIFSRAKDISSSPVNKEISEKQAIRILNNSESSKTLVMIKQASDKHLNMLINKGNLTDGYKLGDPTRVYYVTLCISDGADLMRFTSSNQVSGKIVRYNKEVKKAKKAGQSFTLSNRRYYIEHTHKL